MPAYPPGYRGLLAFSRAVEQPLAPFQRDIARAFFGPEREVCACLARGCGKSHLAALLALHHVLSHPEPSVYIGSGSRQQARIVGEVVQRLAQHPAIRDQLTVRYDEVRLGDRRGPTVLRVVASDGGRALGWPKPTLMIGDEVVIWSDREPSLLSAMQTSLVKSPAAKLFLISTAPAKPDTPLGRIRARALALPDVKRDGSRIDATGHGLRWIEWSVPPEVEPTPEAVKAATPAPWISLDTLREQRHRVIDHDWLVFHANRSHVSAARWLPEGAWSACRADYDIADDEPLTIGVDIGGSRANSAVIGCVADDDGVRVALVEVRTGKAAVLEVVESIRQLAAQRPIAQIVYDPMRFEGEALRLERDLALTLIEWPQHPTRMTRCSENLHRLIVEGRLRHFGHPTLDAHIANAQAKPTDRGWRLVKSAESAHIDAVIALAMSAEMAEKRPEPARILGWI